MIEDDCWSLYWAASAVGEKQSHWAELCTRKDHLLLPVESYSNDDRRCCWEEQSHWAELNLTRCSQLNLTQAAAMNDDRRCWWGVIELRSYRGPAENCLDLKCGAHKCIGRNPRFGTNTCSMLSWRLCYGATCRTIMRQAYPSHHIILFNITFQRNSQNKSTIWYSHLGEFVIS